MKQQSFEDVPVHYGVRGDAFRDFLKNILSLSNLSDEYMNILLDNESLCLYEQAFTHKSSDAENNYECFEFLGDVTLNKSIAWHLARRFPQLNCPKGVKVMTRLKINLISKKSFASFAKQFHFWEFVSASEDIYKTNMDKTLEDVFEAFFGVTEWIADQRIRLGVGYYICYKIIDNILKTKHISLSYDSLFDPKTILKETFDYFIELGKLVYKTQRDEEGLFHVTAHSQQSNDVIQELGQGTGYLKADAQQRAASESLRKIREMGFRKPIPEEYKQFADEEN